MPPPLSFSKKPLFCGNAPNEREEAATLSVEGEDMMGPEPQPEQEGLVGLAACAAGWVDWVLPRWLVFYINS